jgi:hypothetical protein
MLGPRLAAIEVRPRAVAPGDIAAAPFERGVAVVLDPARASPRRAAQSRRPFCVRRTHDCHLSANPTRLSRFSRLRSIGHIARQQRIRDNDADYVDAQDMLAELRDDNQRLVSIMREVHHVCDTYGDVATASVLEVWIDESERRTWFLFESTRGASRSNA